MNRVEQAMQAGVALSVPSEAGPRETTIEVPHREVARFDGAQGTPAAVSGGYFQLSHSVFHDPVLRDLPGDTFRLYLWLSSQGWRFPDSDGSLRASVSFITEALGMPHATVSRGLKLLREKQLISLIETNFKRGNSWQITPKAAWVPVAGKLSQREASRLEAPHRGLTAPSNRGGNHLNLSKKPPQSEAETRNTIPFKKLENSLSNATPNVIRDYLESIKPPRKRESEQACYFQLNLAYKADEITEALRFVRERGVPSSGEPCHSPMAFLTRAMSEVLAEIRRLASAESRAVEGAAARGGCSPRESRKPSPGGRVDPSGARFLNRVPNAGRPGGRRQSMGVAIALAAVKSTGRSAPCDFLLVGIRVLAARMRELIRVDVFSSGAGGFHDSSVPRKASNRTQVLTAS